MKPLRELMAAWEPEEGSMTTVDDSSLRYLIGVAKAADDLMAYHDGGGFRANHPHELFDALRNALTDTVTVTEPHTESPREGNS